MKGKRRRRRHPNVKVRRSGRKSLALGRAASCHATIAKEDAMTRSLKLAASLVGAGICIRSPRGRRCRPDRSDVYTWRWKVDTILTNKKLRTRLSHRSSDAASQTYRASRAQSHTANVESWNWRRADDGHHQALSATGPCELLKAGMIGRA